MAQVVPVDAWWQARPVALASRHSCNSPLPHQTEVYTSRLDGVVAALVQRLPQFQLNRASVLQLLGIVLRARKERVRPPVYMYLLRISACAERVSRLCASRPRAALQTCGCPPLCCVTPAPEGASPPR